MQTKRELIPAIMAVLCVLLPGVFAFSGARGDFAQTVSLCTVLTAPSGYVGKKLNITVLITSFKDGTAIWSPACSRLGADLYIKDASGPGMLS
jgi:hypothetical protein